MSRSTAATAVGTATGARRAGRRSAARGSSATGQQQQSRSPSRTRPAVERHPPWARALRQPWVRRGLWLALTGAALSLGLLLVFEPYSAAHEALPEPLRPFRPLPIRLLNALNLALNTVLGVELIELDADALLATACAKFSQDQGEPAGTACDWGDAEWNGEEWREGFGVLVQALRDEASLTLIGRVFATHRLSMVLEQRLQLVHYWQAEPAVARTDVAPPLFVVGLPRTGTSFLHTLLSQARKKYLLFSPR